MKQAAWLIGMLMLVSAALAQKATYTRIFSGPSYDEGIAAFRLPNHEIRIVGNTGSYGHGMTDIWLIALDSNGDFLWHKFYGTTEVEKAQDAIMTPEGDIFIVGFTSRNYSKSYQIYFLGLDSLGQVIGSGAYGGKDWEFGYSICRTSDSTFALAGETFSYGAGQGDAYLVEVNRRGDTLRTRTYGGPDEDRAWSVKQMPDSSLMLAGGSKSFGNGSFDFYALRLNRTGDTLWSESYSYPTDAEFYAVLIDADTNLVMGGYQKDSAATYRDIDLKFLDAEGNLFLDQHAYLRELSESYISSIVCRPNRELILGGLSSYRPSADARVIRTDSMGYWINSIFLGTNEKDDVAHKLTPDYFHGEYYFMCGTTEDYGVSGSGVFFVRFDSLLNVDTTRMVDLPSSIFREENDKVNVSVYPDPATSHLNIDFDVAQKILDIKVYDVSGREVLSFPGGNNKSIFIDIGHIKPGYYILSIELEKRYIRRKFIKTD